MGRHVGWIALYAGIAASAHAILIPEVPLTIDDICELVSKAHDRGRRAARRRLEGFTLKGMDEAYSDKGLDAFNRPRLGGIGEVLAPEIERITGIETAPRCSVTSSGRLAVGIRPRPRDATGSARGGRGYRPGLGQMVSLKGTDIVRVPFAEALGELNTVPLYRYEEAAALFG